MSDMNSVVEGRVKFRDGKKWKARWCVVKKPSPVADRLHVQLYKDIKDVGRPGQPKTNFYLEAFFGLEKGFSHDKEANILAIVCQKQTVLFAFENKETLIQFEIKLRRSLGEENRFPVQISKVPNHSKLQLERVLLHIHGQKFCFTVNTPPKVIASWQISELRKFGMIDGKFVFEGGSGCAKGAGVHVLTTEQAEDIAEIFQLASQGKTASCRKLNKRRSQFCDYLEPVKNSVSDGVYKDFRNRQVYADQNFLDDNKWPKRHSISYSDYGRASVYDEKQRLMSIENIQREKHMPIYDVPPRTIRKVESFKRKTSANQKFHRQNGTVNLDSSQVSHMRQFNNMSQSQEPIHSAMNNNSKKDNLLESQSSVSSLSVPSSDSPLSVSLEDDSSSPVCLGYMANVSASAPALCGYGAFSFQSENKKNFHSSVPSRIDDEIDRCRRQEALESLTEQEIDLEREISLLDEILQDVQFELKSTRDQPILKEKPPPLPRKNSKSPCRPTHINLSPRDDRYSSISSQGSISGYSDSALLSPNLSAKLRRIPSNSKLSAPLPYVNLAKYDIGDVDNSHVYIPASLADQGNRSAPCRTSSYGNSHVDRDINANKENNVLRSARSRESLGCRRSSAGNAREPVYSNGECIYANAFPFTESSPPPPALPPKGPALLNKNVCSNDSSRPPPIPPGKHRSNLNHHRRDRYSAQYQSPRQGINPVRDKRDRRSQPSYLLMSGFESPPMNNRKFDDSESLKNDSECVLQVKIPKRLSMSKRTSGATAVPCGYMDMSGMFEDEKAISKSRDDVESSSDHSPLKQYVRSHSASAILDIKSSYQQSPQTCTSVASSAPIREENYLLMSHLPSPQKTVLENLQSLQTFVSSTSISEDSRRESVSGSSESDFQSTGKNLQRSYSEDRPRRSSEQNTVHPFPNLMNFQQHVNKSPTNTSNSLTTTCSASVQSVSSEKSENVGKSPGFLTRLIRRNSGNRKSMSQSQENLLASSSSESCLDKTQSTVYRENASMKDLSNSSESSSISSRCPSQQDISVKNTERRRSSSFPNRSSFLEMSSPDGKEVTGKNDSQDSFYSSVSADDQKQLLESVHGLRQNTSNNYLDSAEKSHSGSYYMGPCRNSDNGGDDEGSKSVQGKDTNNKVQDSSNSPKYYKKVQSTKDMGIFTVLHVDQSKFELDQCKNSSKTDDEKLIELMKYQKVKDYYSDTDSEKSESLKSDDLKSKLSPPKTKSMSPSEEAAAIAKHVASLPPFVPPKQKIYPCSLSPVLESNPFVQKDDSMCNSQSEDKRSLRSQTSGVSTVTKADLENALSKITTSKTEEQQDSVWIPRSVSEKSITTTTTTEDQEAKFAALVVEVDEDVEPSDTASLSSHDSSVTSEDAVRSSPASTILRPRSGKEYKVVERKRTLHESLNSSPSQTPNSPSLASTVFTFDQLSVSPSMYSGYSRERDSPNLPKFHRSESIHSDRISPTKVSYMNIDMTPPSSPPYSLGLSLPASERQLNYAEIDLSLPTKVSRKMRKASQRSAKLQKSSSIEYAMIDMEATVAIQRAGREHKMSREDSLRRSDHKLSLQAMKEEVTAPSDLSSTSMPNVKESAPVDFQTPLTTHRYVNVPPPKDDSLSQSPESKDGPVVVEEIVSSPETILLPIRENQDTSSSEDEDDSSDGEVIIVE